MYSNAYWQTSLDRLRSVLDGAWARACECAALVREKAALANKWLTRSRISPRILIGRLGLVTTCITILAPPLTTLSRRHTPRQAFPQSQDVRT